jgi:hypothetical protein
MSHIYLKLFFAMHCDYYGSKSRKDTGKLQRVVVHARREQYFLYIHLIEIQLQLLVVLVTSLLENNSYTFISKRLSLWL